MVELRSHIQTTFLSGGVIATHFYHIFYPVYHFYFEINMYYINNRKKIMSSLFLSFSKKTDHISDTSGIIPLKQMES